MVFYLCYVKVHNQGAGRQGHHGVDMGTNKTNHGGFGEFENSTSAGDIRDDNNVTKYVLTKITR